MNTSTASATQTLTDTIDTSYLNLAPESHHTIRTMSSQSNDGSNWTSSSSGSGASTSVQSSQGEPARRGEVVYPRLPMSSQTPSASQETPLIETKNEKGAVATEFTPLPWSIPQDVYDKAKAAPQGHPDSFWTHKLYTNPSEPAAKIKVHYCKSLHTTENVLKQHFLGKSILGFDIEWKMGATSYSSPKKNVSLIQIASPERIILIHLGLFAKESISDLVAPTLKSIMEDENILKCGVAIKADCTRLRKFLGIDSKGVFELSHLHKLVTHSAAEPPEYGSINKKLVSLTLQAEAHLGLPIFKGEVRGSDWSEALSMEQILYAASDAYAGLAIFNQLEQKRLKLDPCPPRPYPAEMNRPIRLASCVEILVEAPLAVEEDAEEEAPRKTAVDAPHQPVAGEIDIEVLPEDCAETSATTSTDAETKTPNKVLVKKHKAELQELDPIVDAAAQFALKYRATYPKTAASPAQLRAYHIWHTNPDLSVESIAAKLRDPPLQTTTVSNYILEALRTEGRGIVGSVVWLVDPLKVGGEDVRGLPVEVERLVELMAKLPEATKSTWRWKGLWKSVEKK